MALVERLMGLEDPKIPVHTFFAAMQEVVSGNLTGAQVKSYLEMDAAAQAEYDAIAALYPTGTTASAAVNFTVQLRQGYASEGAPGTLIKEWVHTDIGADLVTAEQTLSGDEADSITDYTDLFVRMVAG